ncbi:hypothetical protein [Hymenobacter sp.]|uniref:hypothetical protein n=1 Tax=Hymenobacter sp. TaxID=1898978 RepID=UPI00286B6AA8|nr:hypothetical protein [Hymenobacter sp.]
MSASTELEKLSKLVFKRSNGVMALNQIQELLALDEDAYQRDSPRSIGKTLRVLSVAFSGVKNTGEVLEYVRSMTDGVNLWVGDNSKGKTSIFKVLKLALSGNDSLDKEIMGWLREAWVEFKIGGNSYTVHMTKGDTDRSAVYRFFNANRQALQAFTLEQVEAAQSYKGSLAGYADFVENLFFREFDYYRLQRTQRASQKDNPNLLTATASWKTYFKSIFLEANDNSFFYGNQSELVFQMLLGLELTYPINRLKVKVDNLKNDIGLRKIQATPQAAADPARTAELQAELQENHRKVALLTQNLEASNVPAQAGTLRQLEIERNRYNTLSQLQTSLNADIIRGENDYNELEKQALRAQRQMHDSGVEMNKRNRRINDLAEYEQFGEFFNSLEIKTCPSCSHDVESSLVVQEKKTGSCRLCRTHQVPAQAIEPEAYAEQLEQLKAEAQAFKDDEYNFKVKLADLRHKQGQLKSELGDKRQRLGGIHLQPVVDEIGKLEQASRAPQAKVVDVMATVAEMTTLNVRKAAVEAELVSLAAPSGGPDAQLAEMEQKVELLEIARTELLAMQAERSKTLLRQLEGLYLKHLKAFGLLHYEQVTIDGDFRIHFTKHEQDFKFDELSPGEQLRAKLGLYIALIDMDVQFQNGRHPRFIMLDSPAGEEADQTFLEGLKETLAYIESALGKELQVFVGTAQRELQAAAVAEKVDVRRRSEYFF